VGLRQASNRPHIKDHIKKDKNGKKKTGKEQEEGAPCEPWIIAQQIVKL
jgi:hypothetical protein